MRPHKLISVELVDGDGRRSGAEYRYVDGWSNPADWADSVKDPDVANAIRALVAAMIRDTSTTSH
jgi:hypothetical protein